MNIYSNGIISGFANMLQSKREKYVTIPEKYVTIPAKLCTHQKPRYAQRFLNDFEVEHTISSLLQKALHPTIFRLRKDQIMMNIYNRLECNVSLVDLRSAIRNCIDSETSVNNERFSPSSLSQLDFDVIVLDVDSNEVSDHHHIGGLHRGYGSVVIYCGISTLVEDSTPEDSLETLAYKCKYIHNLSKKEAPRHKASKKADKKADKKSKKESRSVVQDLSFVNESELNALFKEVDEIAFDTAAVETISKKMSEISSKSRYYDALSQLKAKVQLGIVTGVKDQMNELEAKYGKAYDTYKKKDRNDFLVPREQLAPSPMTGTFCETYITDLPIDATVGLPFEENQESFY